MGERRTQRLLLSPFILKSTVTNHNHGQNKSSEKTYSSVKDLMRTF